MSAPALSLYVHLPWCVRKCPYCDFNSHQLKSGAPDPQYMDALLADLDRDLELVRGRRIETIFFGGGTPSLFAPADFARLLAGVRARAEITPDAEVTLEANPGTIERGAFAGYRDAGINRVSLGAQSFSAAALRALGRIHSVEETERAVVELESANLRNFNLDLMYALPNQSIEQAVADVRRACALKPPHLSHYQLTLEPGTVFATKPPPLPDDDAAWQMQLECQTVLADQGYAQYEVSAYAREGFRCRHNLNYWRFGDYLGIGAGAHGKLTLADPYRILRTEKPTQPREYLRSLVDNGAATLGAPATCASHVGTRRVVPVRELPFEFMLNALRLNEGFASSDYTANTGLALAGLQNELAEARRRGLLEPRTGGWRASDLGRRFLNDLQAGFLNGSA